MSEGKYLKDAALLNKASHILALDADGSVGRIAPSTSNGLGIRNQVNAVSSGYKEWVRVAKIATNAADGVSLCEVSLKSQWGSISPYFMKLRLSIAIATWNKEEQFAEGCKVQCLLSTFLKADVSKIRLVRENPKSSSTALYLEVNCKQPSRADVSNLSVVVDRIFGNAEAIAQPCEGNVPDGAWVKEINLADITVQLGGGGKRFAFSALQIEERRMVA